MFQFESCVGSGLIPRFLIRGDLQGDLGERECRRLCGETGEACNRFNGLIGIRQCLILGTVAGVLGLFNMS